MSFASHVTGAVIRYPYLWSHERDWGETEGRKSHRPTVVGFRIARRGGDVLLLFPITSKEPSRGRFAAEIPATEKHRAGLDPDARLWIVFDEFNEDRVGHSHYLNPEPPLGRLSRAFLLPLLRQFIARRGAVRRVRRNA